MASTFDTEVQAPIALSEPRDSWATVLAGIHAEALDCLQSTVAVIADAAYGSGAHLALGSRWGFPVLGADGSYAIQPTVAERIEQAHQILGFQVGEPSAPLTARSLRELADQAPVYVVAEAYDLSWLPYAKATVRYRQMPHSFLLERADDGYLIVDAYYADTQWGRARPTTYRMSAAGIDTAIGGTGIGLRMVPAESAIALDRTSVLAATAASAAEAGRAIDGYLAQLKSTLSGVERVERLVLDIWHVCRERLLTSRWLGDHPAAAAVEAATRGWQQLAGQSYLASRRAQRGAPPNPALLDDMAERLYADLALLSEFAEPVTASAEPERVRTAVLAAVADVLRLQPAEVELTGELRALTGFDSFRLVEIIDRIETGLGVPFPATASAGDLLDVAGLCRLFGGQAP
ncbi:MAG TPA: acyl carrier protein [Jatrophihabitans sp.]|nr:acyl carrier protein [Jatrophihabitans sp.]